jgi:hypothetical protein
MMQRKLKTSSHQGNRKGRAKTKGVVTPSVSTIVYSGPLRLPKRTQQRRTVTVEVAYDLGQVTTSAGGVWSPVFSNNPSGAATWASKSQNWDEYRTLGFTFYYEPASKYCSTNGTAKYPVCAVVDRDSSAALTTYAGAYDYESCELFSFEEKYSRGVRMADIGEATFVNTAAPTATLWLKFYSGTNANSYNMGRCFIVYLIEFVGQI